jgi:ABC-type amino acid transport substrate-binding protein
MVSWRILALAALAALLLAPPQAAAQAPGEAERGAFLRQLGEPQALRDLPRQWQLPRLVTPGRLTVATTGTAPPRTQVDPQTGRLGGSYVGLFEQLARDLGLEVEFVRVGWPAILPGLAANRFDIACDGAAWTRERLASPDFLMTSPTAVNATVGLARRGVVGTWGEAAGKRLGGVRGEVYFEGARRLVPGVAQALEFPGQTELLLALANRQVDVAAMNLSTAQDLIARSPIGRELVIVGPPLEVFAQSLCVNPRQPELLVAVNTLLGNYRADGTLMRLVAEHSASTAEVELLGAIGYAAHGARKSGGEASDAFLAALGTPRAIADLPRPWPLRSLVTPGRLTIANAANLPGRFFTDPASGQFRGAYFELFRQIAADLGLELVVERVAFAGQLPGLAANRFDMACTGTSWTAQRLATTDFLMTGPTGVNATVGMVRNDSPVRGWPDGSGRRLGGVRGELYLESARRALPGASQVLEFPGHPEGLLALLNRQVDLHAANLTIALATLQGHPMRAQFRMILPPLDSFAQSLCVNPRQGDLLVAVNTLLGNYRADGTLARLVGQFGDTAEVEVLRAIGY